VCKDCADIRGGSFFCKDTCTAPEEKGEIKPVDAPPTASVPQSPMPDQRAIQSPVIIRKASVNAPLAWIIIAVSSGLVSILIAGFAVYQNYTLTKNIERISQDLFVLTDQTKMFSDQFDILRAEVRHFKEEVFSQPPGIARLKPLSGSWSPALPATGTALSFDNGPIDKKQIALTFDGSSFANAALDILDTLTSRNVISTMFISGEFIRKFPEIVKRMMADGHEIGNHTFSHPHLTAWEKEHNQGTLSDISPVKIEQELRKANEAYRSLTGAHLSPLWRAPYGERNPQVCAWAKAAGYVHIGWRQGRTWRENLDSNDWVPDEETPGYHAPADVYDKIMALAKSEPYGINGGIILMHLGTVRMQKEKQVHRILGKLIDDVRSLGYEIVPVSTMVKEAGINLDSLHVLQVSGFANQAGE
jgi:peptidoglycan/xylan/chitin deacetylase (PgdA/CDA1 family)